MGKSNKKTKSKRKKTKKSSKKKDNKQKKEKKESKKQKRIKDKGKRKSTKHDGDVSASSDSQKHKPAFAEDPPRIEPDVAVVVLPCHGGDQFNIQIKINNNSVDRMVYKVHSTKERLFDIKPEMGFIEPMTTGIVNCTPLQIMNDFGLSPYDHFAVNMNIAPAGDQLQPVEVWKRCANPGRTITKKVPIKFVGSEQARKALLDGAHESTLKVKILPKELRLITPGKAKVKECQFIEINNRGKYRIAFKIRGTCPDKYRLDAVTGFVNPGATFLARCQPLRFIGREKYGAKHPDRMTVLVAKAHGTSKTGDPTDSKGAERNEIKIIYVDRDPNEADDPNDEYFSEDDFKEAKPPKDSEGEFKFNEINTGNEPKDKQESASKELNEGSSDDDSSSDDEDSTNEKR